MVTTRRGRTAPSQQESEPAAATETKKRTPTARKAPAAPAVSSQTKNTKADAADASAASSSAPAAVITPPTPVPTPVSPPAPVRKAKKSNVAVPAPSKGEAFHYEFGGPVGALGIIIGLPVMVLFLASASGDYLLRTDKLVAAVTSLSDIQGTSSLPAWQSVFGTIVDTASSPLSYVQGLWDPKWFGIYVAWFVFQVILERILPAETHLGVPLSGSGKRLEYRVNGHLAFWISLLVLGHFYPVPDDEGRITSFTAFPLEELYLNFDKLALSSIVFSYLLSLYIYLMSFLQPLDQLAEGGKSGNVIYDFYIGRELNPRIGSFDWKYFCELRPGLIGWVVLNLGMLKHLVESTPGADIWPILLVNLFQGWYVVDALIHEKAILTTMDITTDGFGFMLVFGDLAWVPFTYSLQAKYLAENSAGLSTWGLVAIAALNVVGYTIFRQANSIKDLFRQDPAKVPHIKYLETARGTRLMISSWWGWARKINYTGDWLMGLAWCLLAGSKHLVPYFYCTYFGVLLLHRAARDDHSCAIKYGKDWEAYKKAVPYRFIPGVY